ncbi:MAG: FeoB-associated Cys-rich membrane protein [Clostridiales bacterium]|nr:FeoB-associated Cys-rich membrane protein [Clostridiales bacterium]
MIELLIANMGTIVVLLVVCGIVAAIVVNMIQKKRRGESAGCSCGCSGCPKVSDEKGCGACGG